MKKRILTLILCGVLSAGLIAGCGKNDGEIKQKEETGETLIETKPVEVPDDTPENTSVSSEPAGKDGDVETKLPGPDEEPFVPETFHAPDGYEEYTYGSAPLSSVYILLAYYNGSQGGSEDLIDLGLNGLSPEQFISELDKYLYVLDASEDNRKENLLNLLLVSGLSDGSEEQISGFFDGNWLPDGTFYEPEEYPAVSYDDSFEREHAYNTVVCGEDYKLWVSVSSYGTNRTDKTASGAVNYTLYTVDGSKNHLTADDFTAEYIGELKNLTITGIDSAATDADDKVVICVSVSLSDVTGDEIIFENDFQLIDKDGDIVEKKFDWN